MILQLSAENPPRLVDLDRLDRLHAEADGALAEMQPSSLFEADDDGEHVWLSIAEARAIGVAEIGGDFGTQFDGMIAYATTKGWLDEAGTRVRAHLA